MEWRVRLSWSDSLIGCNCCQLDFDMSYVSRMYMLISDFTQFRSFCLQVLSLLLVAHLTHETLLNKALHIAQP